MHEKSKKSLSYLRDILWCLTGLLLFNLCKIKGFSEQKVQVLFQFPQFKVKLNI